MSKFSDDTLAEPRERLHELMMGFARVQASGMDALVRADWLLAARLEQLRRHPLVSAFDDAVLAAVASGDLVPNVEARYLATRLREVEAEAAAETAAQAQADEPAIPRAAGQVTDLPPQAVALMADTIRLIARSHLRVEALTVRGWDSLDIHTCHVRNLRAALVEAFVEGWHAKP